MTLAFRTHFFLLVIFSASDEFASLNHLNFQARLENGSGSKRKKTDKSIFL